MRYRPTAPSVNEHIGSTGRLRNLGRRMQAAPGIAPSFFLIHVHTTKCRESKDYPRRQERDMFSSALSIYLSIYLAICPIYLSICPICPSIHPSLSDAICDFRCGWAKGIRSGTALQVQAYESRSQPVLFEYQAEACKNLQWLATSSHKHCIFRTVLC